MRVLLSFLGQKKAATAYIIGNYGLSNPLYSIPGRSGAAKGRTTPLSSPFLPNLLRPNLLRPRIRFHFIITEKSCIGEVLSTNVCRKRLGPSHLPGPFLQIAIPAEHLAVVRRGVPALAPGRDVVGVHLLKLKFLPAEGAFMALPLVGPGGQRPGCSASAGPPSAGTRKSRSSGSRPRRPEAAGPPAPTPSGPGPSAGRAR